MAKAEFETGRRPARRAPASWNVHGDGGECASRNGNQIPHTAGLNKPEQLAATRIAARFGLTRPTAALICSLAGLGGRGG